LFAASLLSACSVGDIAGLAGFGQQVAQQTVATTIGARQADEPMHAVESYLREYQPGAEPRLFQTTRIYDRQGRLLAELMGEGRRTWVPLSRVSQHLIDATIATEDSTFYTNNGIDPARIAGAALQNLQEGEIVSGASTITMQLARNLFLPPEKRYDPSVDRKALEMNIAQELTALYSKDEILEMYLNLLNYGQLAYGPEAAAQVYFGKSASDLSLAEASFLAGIPQQPANLNPYRNFEAVRQRQQVVLALMVRHGYLTQAQADQAFAQGIELAGDPGLAPNLAPHFVQYVIDTLDAIYGDGFTRRAGLNIYTTLDLDIQKLAQETVQRTVAELRPRYDLGNAALVAMRPGSGEILAMVGSADFSDDAIAGQVNVAVSPRQPGSAIKPVLYATAMNDDLISPASVMWDTPITYTVGPGDVYRPQNYDERFHGPVTARTALANSYNVPAVKLLDGVGVERMLAGAQAMGINSLNQASNWYGLSLTLGGGEVTLLDLTTAFHTLASGGQYYSATPFLAITDNLGDQIDDGIPEGGAQVITPESAFLVTDILSDNAARTPAFGVNNSLTLSRPAAVKTGTTSDWRDNWTVGYTRYLLAGVWAGNSDGHPMRNVSGVTGAAPIWNAFMEAVLADPAILTTLGASPSPEDWAFTPPAGVEKRDECPPGVSCREGGEYFSQSWLTEMGDAGPLGDSVVDMPAAPVYAQSAGSQVLAGFCHMPGAVMRTVLTLPDGFGNGDDDAQPAPDDDATPTDAPVADHGTDPATASSPALTDEQALAVVWSLRNGSRANLGDCDSLAPRVEAALRAVPEAAPELAQSGVRVLIDLQAAYWPDVPPGPTPGAVELARFAGSGGAYGTYALRQPIWHDYACPGQYIMGQVLNRNGAPVAGVRIMARDEWGNVAQAVSKNGAADYGWFDFMITSSTPHDIYVTVLDPAGNPASPTITVQHRYGPGGDAPCHYLIFQGG
jgi:penicillin-binding protein 1C